MYLKASSSAELHEKVPPYLSHRAELHSTHRRWLRPGSGVGMATAAPRLALSPVSTRGFVSSRIRYV